MKLHRTRLTAPPRPPLRAIAALLLTLTLAACGSSGADLAMHDGDTLRAERDEWRGPKDGLVVLRRGVHGIVDTAVDPRRASSRMIVHLAETRFGPAPGRESVTVLAPAGATVDTVRARLVRPEGEEPLRPATVGRRDGDVTVDPGQVVWELTFDAIPAGAILEVVVELDVPGILTGDAQWLEVPGAPTHELLLRYDVPSDAVGSFAIVGAQHRPIVTEKDGYKVIALLLSKLPARGDAAAAPYARFVTAHAAPRGYDLPIARTWGEATATYVAGLVDASRDLRAGYAAPFATTLTGKDAVLALTTWVRDRLQRADATSARWDAARSLVAPLEGNDLTQTDKVHLLHWLLDEAKVDHRFAVARGTRFPPLERSLPTPEAFDTPLLYVPALDLWLDPACRECEPGVVRPELRSGSAILLPATAAPVTLP